MGLMRNCKKQGCARCIAFGLCTAVFIVTGLLWGRDVLRGMRERAANDSLARQVHKAEEQMAVWPSCSLESLDTEPGILPQYAALWEQNNDMAGWLSIEGTDIDYPVMFTPEQPEYYLHRAFDGSYAASGSLFIGEGCAPDSSHVIIYGHHMKNGTMFGSLPLYAKEDYAQEHPVISFDTLTQKGEYEVMAAFYSQVYTKDTDDRVFRYYAYKDLSQKEVFEDYVQQAKAASLYDTGVEAAFGDQIITLSTCSYHTENGRFVVVARKM